MVNHLICFDRIDLDPADARFHSNTLTLSSVAEAKWVEASDLVTAVLAEGADAAYTPWFINDLTFLVNEAKVAPLVAADD